MWQDFLVKMGFPSWKTREEVREQLGFFFFFPSHKLKQRKPRATWSWENIFKTGAPQKFKFINEIRWRVVLTLKSRTLRANFPTTLTVFIKSHNLFMYNSLDTVVWCRLECILVIKTKMTKFYSGSESKYSLKYSRKGGTFLFPLKTK